METPTPMKPGEPEWEPDYMTEDPTSAEQTSQSEEMQVYSDEPVTQLPEELEKPIDNLLGELSEFPEQLQQKWNDGAGKEGAIFFLKRYMKDITNIYEAILKLTNCDQKGYDLQEDLGGNFSDPRSTVDIITDFLDDEADSQRKVLLAVTQITKLVNKLPEIYNALAASHVDQSSADVAESLERTPSPELAFPKLGTPVKVKSPYKGAEAWRDSPLYDKARRIESRTPSDRNWLASVLIHKFE